MKLWILVSSHSSGFNGKVCKSTEIGEKNTLPKVGSQQRCFFEKTVSTDLLQGLFARFIAHNIKDFIDLFSDLKGQEVEVRYKVRLEFIDPEKLFVVT